MIELQLNDQLRQRIAGMVEEFNLIPAERKDSLDALGVFISEKIKSGDNAELLVVCTHNSRRSQIGQLWLEAAAAWYNIAPVNAFSGGTEATAFYRSAVDAMREAGFELEKKEEGPNPVYHFEAGKSLKLFSKKYDHADNPSAGFAAIMVCDDADANCPVIIGADARFSISFIDPKVSDGSPAETSTYIERCRQIGREMLYAMSVAKAAL